jgi:Ricin-type beta-trefoil lectin domain-like
LKEVLLFNVYQKLTALTSGAGHFGPSVALSSDSNTVGTYPSLLDAKNEQINIGFIMANKYFIKSKLDGNVIDIVRASTSSGAGLDAFPQKSSGTDNQLWEFVPAPSAPGYFLIKSTLNGNVIEVPADLALPGVALNVTSLITSSAGQLWQFYEDPAGSGYYYIMSKLNGFVIDIEGASTKPGALLDLYPPKSSGTDNQLWQVVGGSFPSPVASMTAPGAGLGSNSNYLMSNCGNMTEVSVMVNVTQDIVGSDGFGFQLNGYSAKSDFDAAQQYLIYLDPHSSPAQLNCMVDNWTITPKQAQIINHIVPLATLPSQKLPAGYALGIFLQNDSSGKITGAQFTAFDNKGNSIGSQTITPLSLNQVSGGKVTSADLAPIVAFQVNFVDYLNGGVTTLSSGAGYMTIASNKSITVESSEPSCVDWDYVTVERANSSYGKLPANPNGIFTQTFQTAAAVIDKQAKVRHKTSGLSR